MGQPERTGRKPNNPDQGLVQYADELWGFDIRLGEARVRRKIGTKTEARQAMAEVKREWHQVGMVPDGGGRLNELIEHYLPELLEATPGSQSQTRLYARNWMEDFGPMPPSEVTAALLLEWRRDRASCRARSTVNRELNFLRQLFKRLVRDKVIAARDNPFVEVQGYRVANQRRRILSSGEEERLRAVLPPEHWDLPELALLMGMRRKNQFALQVDQVDLEREHVRLWVKAKGAPKEHYLFLGERAKAILERRIGNRKRGPVFLGPRGAAMDPSNWAGRVWRPALREAGIEDLTWHDLRRTCACRLLDAGATMEQVKEVLGHASVSTTEQRYAWVQNEQMRKVMRLLDSPKKDARKDCAEVLAIEKWLREA